MPAIIAQLTDINGNIIPAAAYAANADGSPPALISIGPGAFNPVYAASYTAAYTTGLEVAAFAALYNRGPDTRRVLGTPADWYALTGPAGPPGETGDPQLSIPGRGSPGLENPGDPGGTATAVIYLYGYVYSAPVLTSTGESNGRT
jgi:hypothetical protein